MQSIAPSSALNVYFKNKLGNSQVVGNYDGTPANGIFKVSPVVTGDVGIYYEIYTISVDMRLTSTIDVTKYGLGTALDPGITITCDPAFDSTHFEPIIFKTNQDLEKYFNKENKLSDKTLMGKYRIFMDVGEPIMLKGKLEKKPDELIITSTEDLTSRFTASTNSFMAHGKWGSL